MTQRVMLQAVGGIQPERSTADLAGIARVQNIGAAHLVLVVFPRRCRACHLRLLFRTNSLVTITRACYRPWCPCQYNKLRRTHYGRFLVSQGPGAGQRDAGRSRPPPASCPFGGVPHDEGRTADEAVGNGADRRLSRCPAGGGAAPFHRGFGSSPG